MKITMLSHIDYSGSGYKLCEAIKRYTDHDIEFFAGPYYNPYKHPTKKILDYRKLQKRINASDIIHLKGDWPPWNGYLRCKILHKPIIITVSGSQFRKKEHGGYGKYELKDYKRCILRTAFTPDICYGDFIWTPHPIDSIGKPNLWEKRDPMVFLHTPTRKDFKGTGLVLVLFGKLRNEGIRTVITSGLSFKEVVEKRKRATIFFDQFKVGFYGNSAIEAMQFGIPVAAWIREPLVEKNPIISVNGSADKWFRVIKEVLNGDLEDLSHKTKLWCDSIHSYQSVAEQWNGIYNTIGKG